MLTEGRIDKTYVSEDLRRVCNVGEQLKALLEVFLVVGLEGGGPSVELCFERHVGRFWTKRVDGESKRDKKRRSGRREKGKRKTESTGLKGRLKGNTKRSLRLARA